MNRPGTSAIDRVPRQLLDLRRAALVTTPVTNKLSDFMQQRRCEFGFRRLRKRRGATLAVN